MENIEDTIYRILAGFYFIEVSGILYKVVSPSLQDKYEAQFIYRLALDNNKFESGWLSENEKNKFLDHFKIWNKDKEEIYKDLEEQLKKAKIELYLQFNHPDNKKHIQSAIITINKQLEGLFYDKHSLDHLTLHSYASSLKNQFLISKIIYLNNELVFKQNFDNIDVNLLQSMVLEIHKNTLTIDTIKKIARHDIWRGLWSAGKDKIFSNPTIELTDEQISLINISRTLDSIREHPECPSEDIINDFDALDGWLYYQQDKIDKEKKKQAINDKYGLDKKNGSEIFLVTNSKEEAKEIYSLNSNETKRNLKEMSNFLKEKGEAEWSQVPFVQRELKSKVNQVRK